MRSSRGNRGHKADAARVLIEPRVNQRFLQKGLGAGRRRTRERIRRHCRYIDVCQIRTGWSRPDHFHTLLRRHVLVSRSPLLLEVNQLNNEQQIWRSPLDESSRQEDARTTRAMTRRSQNGTASVHIRATGVACVYLYMIMYF